MHRLFCVGIRTFIKLIRLIRVKMFTKCDVWQMHVRNWTMGCGHFLKLKVDTESQTTLIRHRAQKIGVFSSTIFFAETWRYWCEGHVVSKRLWVTHAIQHGKPFNYCNSKFPGRVVLRFSDQNWLPRSFDLMPLNFFLLGFYKLQVNVNKPTKRQVLKEDITRCINKIPQHLCKTIFTLCIKF